MYFRQLHRSTFYVKFVWAVYSAWVMKPAWGCANEAAVQTPTPQFTLPLKQSNGISFTWCYNSLNLEHVHPKKLIKAK